MATAKTRAVEKYNNKTYDRVTFRVSKGRKQEIDNAARKAGMSTTAFIVASVEEKMMRGKVLRDGG